MTRIDGCWIALGGVAALLLAAALEVFQDYRACRDFGNGRARCIVFATERSE